MKGQNVSLFTIEIQVQKNYSIQNTITTLVQVDLLLVMKCVESWLVFLQLTKVLIKSPSGSGCRY